MKYTTLSIICFLILCYGNFNAQNYIEITVLNKEKITNKLQPQNNPMPDLKKNWTKESVTAINKIIEKYGYPDERSPNRLQWSIPGEIKRTITYTENFLFYLPTESDSCNIDSADFNIKKSIY